MYGAQAQKEKPKSLEQQLKEQLVGSVLSQALNPTSFLSSYMTQEPYMAGMRAGSTDYFGGLFG